MATADSLSIAEAEALNRIRHITGCITDEKVRNRMRRLGFVEMSKSPLEKHGTFRRYKITELGGDRLRAWEKINGAFVGHISAERRPVDIEANRN